MVTLSWFASVVAYTPVPAVSDAESRMLPPFAHCAVVAATVVNTTPVPLVPSVPFVPLVPLQTIELVEVLAKAFPLPSNSSTVYTVPPFEHCAVVAATV